MKKVRKICCEITPRRIIVTVLLAATVVNLIIVGAAFEASAPDSASAFTETQTIPAGETTLPPPTVIGGVTTPASPAPLTAATETFINTPTETATPTMTETATQTSTFTSTPSPSPTLCTPYYSWPVYIVQRGDWLAAIADATGSSVNELSIANCLVSTVIYPGQELRVRHLPVDPPTHTATTPPNMPTEFRISSLLACDPPLHVSLAVLAHDPQGVLSVAVRFYTNNGTFIDQILMQPDGDTYFGSASIAQRYTVYDIDHYSFIASDSFQNVTVSQRYYDRSASCIRRLTATPPTPVAPQ